MPKRTESRVFVPLLFASGLLVSAGGTNAYERAGEHVQNATGVCQAALPAFEGQIRKRPLALQNEGTSNAFVSCSLMGVISHATGLFAGKVFGVQLWLDNNSGAPISVTCTLVEGRSGGTENVHIVKTVTMPAGSKDNEMSWSQDPDFGGGMLNGSPSISCNLLPGTGISSTHVHYWHEIGQ
jgi:hypothetical protein